MKAEKTEELVRLLQDVPELGLHRGDVGVICSTWFDPSTAFEVEFHPDAPAWPVRTLLMPTQIRRDATHSTH